MSEVTRRRFLWSAGAAAGGIGLTNAALGQEQPGDAVMVPMEVEPTPGWLTWIGATTSCLRALGCECDAVDVAGMTGYAFILNVPETVGVWGPTGFPWGMLRDGVNALGRSTLEYYACEQREETYRAAYELVEREVGAGRPCVMNGAYVPEFAAVAGVGDDHYNFVGAYGEGPLPYDKLDAPGGVYVLAFPTVVKRPDDLGDRLAISHAIQLLQQSRNAADHDMAWGLAAYEAWVHELEAGNADSWGNSYCAACYAESRHFAQEFLIRVAARHTDVEPLQHAADAYIPTIEAMDRLSELFPFPGEAGKQVEDPIAVAEAVDLLTAAREGEAAALEAMEEAAAVGWGD